MRKILMLCLCLSTFSIASSQNQSEKKAAFHLSFISPFGTNGLQSPEYTNGASLNILVGVSKNEQFFTLGGIANIIKNNASGLQIAGVSNFVGNEGRGIQIGGITNLNGGSFTGLQIGGVLNTAAETKGWQIGGIANLTKSIEGIQIGGVANVNGSHAKGVLIAGVANVVGAEGCGLQIGGVANVSGANYKGIQIGGIANIAQDVTGFQLGGVVNIAKKVKGVQFAGVINIAEDSDIPIGIINIIKNGEMGVAATYDGIGNAVLSFRSGGKYTYGIIGVGYNHRSTQQQMVYEGGLGVHIPVVSWFRINQELKSSSLSNYKDSNLNNYNYSIIPAFKIGKHFELFAGVSLNYMHTDDTKLKEFFPNQSIWKHYKAESLEQVYLGYQAGLQYIF